MKTAKPDFDWSWQERDVILEYIFNRYGYENVAFGTNVEFKYRSIFREVGRFCKEVRPFSQNPMRYNKSNSVVKCKNTACY
jgi:DNA polymerase-3 subunit alpha/error-prone DNA polymerase